QSTSPTRTPPALRRCLRPAPAVRSPQSSAAAAARVLLPAPRAPKIPARARYFASTLGLLRSRTPPAPSIPLRRAAPAAPAVLATSSAAANSTHRFPFPRPRLDTVRSAAAPHCSVRLAPLPHAFLRPAARLL